MNRRRGITPIFVFSGDNLEELNDNMWRTIQLHGRPLKFGTPAIGKFQKKAWEIFSVTQLYGEALERLYNGNLPNGWRFSAACNQEYMDSLKNPDRGDQYYTYGARFHEANQAERIRHELENSIKTGVQSNRIVGIIWDKYQDLGKEEPPCWQWCQTRLMEDNLISLRTLFRSHCFVNGDFANYSAIIRLFRDEVIEPADGELSELINVSTSAQIGSGDVDTVFDRVGNWLDTYRFFNAMEPYPKL